MVKKPYKRSKLGRELAYKRSYKLYKKSKMMAYIWWIFAAGFGAHRFYLGDNKMAMALLCATGVMVVTMYNTSSMGNLSTWALGFYILFLFIEGCYIPFRLKKKNQQLETRLKQEFELE